jgi:GNAT superfamily N-acetyltransferase
MVGNEVRIRPITDADRPLVTRLVAEFWGADVAVVHGTVFRPAELPGFLAEDGGPDPCGLLTYTPQDEDTVEVVTIDARRRTEGVGTALLTAAVAAAAAMGATRLVLTTTNDNVDALRFYQRRGFRLVALRPDAVTASRVLKPSIPLVGDHGIPLTDELDLARPVP